MAKFKGTVLVDTDAGSISALGESGEPIDTRLPEAPQLSSIESQRKRQLIEQIVAQDNPRPDDDENPTPEADAASKSRKK